MDSSEEINQVFIGGWENTGTRLVVKLLKHKGYNTLKGTHNKQYDYNHRHMHKIIYDILNNNGDPYHITNIIKKDTEKLNKWVIKNGYLMLIIPILKEIFPKSKFILCVRHPLDTLIKPSFNYKYFGISEIENPPIIQKFKLYKEWYDKALKYADYVIRLEDLLIDREKTISNLYDFLNINTDINDKILNVIKNPSDNVGRSYEILEYINMLGYC